MTVTLTRFFQLTWLAYVLLLCGPATAQAASQSPIDIRPENTFFGKLAPLQFTLSSDTSLSVINNGAPHEDATVKANVHADAGKLMLSEHEWNLAQFHFHTPSEHLQNGNAFPMEMHLVFSDAADNLLVVGRWVEEGSFNSALDPIFSHLPQTASDTLNVDHFNLNTLLPNNLESFRYAGSLTTPPFSEGLSWVQLAEPLHMSGSQIHAFSSLFPHGDSREIQALDGRLASTDIPGFATAVPEPETYAMLLLGLGLIGFFAARQNRWRPCQTGFQDSIA